MGAGGGGEDRNGFLTHDGGADSAVRTCAELVDISLPLPDLKARITDLCRGLFPEKWSSVDDSRFEVETISGGITNLLLKVSTKEEKGKKNDAVTVRLYGPNTDFVIDRQRELQAIRSLSAAGFGAKLFGLFNNGMVQSFIDARTLDPQDLRKPKLAAVIAKQLRQFHQVDVPGSKEPQLWHDISKFFEKASGLEFDDDKKQKMYSEISFDELRNEISQLKDLSDLLHAPVVFAHNDLLSGNLMLNESEENLHLIDFEYGSYSYRGYDIGNHFNEYAGFDCDYSLYPSKDAQYHFFRNYLQPDEPQKAHDRDLEVLYVEANTYALASHIYWALWALIQAKISPIDFDYLQYFFHRYNEYKRQKDSRFQLAHGYLSRLGINR